MTTPIIITTLLLAPSVVAFIWSAVSGRHRPPLQTTAAIGLAAVFSFTGMGHFIKTEGMVEMMPPRMPMRHASVIASGFFEWALAIGLLLPRTRRLAAMISGTTIKPGEFALKYAKTQEGGARDAQVVASDIMLPIIPAAVINGMLGHALRDHQYRQPLQRVDQHEPPGVPDPELKSRCQPHLFPGASVL